MQQIPENKEDVRELLRRQMALLAKKSQEYEATGLAICSEQMLSIAKVLLDFNQSVLADVGDDSPLHLKWTSCLKVDGKELR